MSKSLCLSLSCLLILVGSSYGQNRPLSPPNILFCIADDQTWLHTSTMGTPEIHTPHFDQVARRGILFENAYCAASSCAPSRAAILTGQEIWRLEEGGLLFGGLSKSKPIFTELLRQHGYQTAQTGKGYAPANLELDKYWNQPIGEVYNEQQVESPEGIASCDYAANFEQFLQSRDSSKPFFFWYGGFEPHRPYQFARGATQGKNLTDIVVPGFLPDHEVTRNDMADYFSEIEWFDDHLGRMLSALEASGELDNTIIVVTADNGMPFPRAKTTGYEYGTHMPLAICWGNRIKGSRKVTDFVSFTDFAPTFLALAGVEVPDEVTGRSLVDVLLSDRSGRVDTSRDRVFTALERHTYCRPDGMPYPIRTIRKGKWLYIHNFAPDRWPAGHPTFDSPHQGVYGDVDAGPTRTYILSHQNDPSVRPFYKYSFAKRPQEELYDVMADPDNVNNLADKEAYAALKKALQQELFTYLRQTNDPRMKGESPWDNYPYYFTDFESRHLKPVGQRDSLER